MILPLPPMYGLVMEACANGSWHVAEYDGAGFTKDQTFLCTGIVAVRGDIRVQVEWAALSAAGQMTGPWQHRTSHITVRHESHDPADFRAVYPRRWFYPGTRDGHRRRMIAAVLPAVRLLSRDDATLTEVVLTSPVSHRTRHDRTSTRT